MLKTTISKFKKVCALSIVPRILRGDMRLGQFHKLSVTDFLRIQRNTLSGSHDSDKDVERCKKIIDMCFGPPNYNENYAENEPITKELVQVIPLSKEEESKKCERIINELFSVEPINQPIINQDHGIPINVQLATTVKEEKEVKLVPKIETLKEPKLESEVKEHKPEVHPTIVGSTAANIDFVKANELDELATRCIDTAGNLVDGCIIREMERIAASKANMQGKLMEVGIIGKEEKPLSNVTESFNQDVESIDLQPPYQCHATEPNIQVSEDLESLSFKYLLSSHLFPEPKSRSHTNAVESIEIYPQDGTQMKFIDKEEDDDAITYKFGLTAPAHLFQKSIPDFDSDVVQSIDENAIRSDDRDIIEETETYRIDTKVPLDQNVITETDSSGTEANYNVEKYDRSVQPQVASFTAQEENTDIYACKDIRLEIYITDAITDQPSKGNDTYNFDKSDIKLDNNTQFQESTVLLTTGDTPFSDDAAKGKKEVSKKKDELEKRLGIAAAKTLNKNTKQTVHDTEPKDVKFKNTIVSTSTTTDAPIETTGLKENVLEIKVKPDYYPDPRLMESEASLDQVHYQLPLTDEEIFEKSLEPPKLNDEFASLSELLERVRLRNKYTYCKENGIPLMQSIMEPSVGSCKKTPPCPPKPQKCPPEAPAEPPKCPPPAPKCPKPCKPACSPCDQPKNPCAKFKKTGLTPLVRDFLLLITQVGIQPSMLDCIPKIYFSGRYPKNTFDNFYPKNFEPWCPIPSWPVPKKEEKKTLVCPKEGCKIPKLNPPCKENPCINMPLRRTYGITDFFSTPFHDVYGDFVWWQ